MIRLWLMLLACCTGPVTDTVDEGSQVLLTSPVLAHAPIAGPVPEGEALSLGVVTEDEDGVASVTAWVRTSGSIVWRSVGLKTADGSTWTGFVAEELVRVPGVEYWIEAIDGSDWQVPGAWPSQGPDEPHRVEVWSQALSLPYVEDFESANDARDLYALGWSEHGPSDFTWELSALNANSGEWSAFHRSGAHEVETFADWLVSPALNFSAETSVGVRWRELGVSSALAKHALYLSTTSSDPQTGAFVKVADVLAAVADGAWGRAAEVDLSAWAGSDRVWLAWYYEGVSMPGGHSDAWYIDDIEVGPLEPDLILVDVLVPPADPGTALDLTVSLQNRGGQVMTDLVLYGEVETGSGSFGPPQVTDLVAVGSTWEATLTLSISGEQPDNSRMQVILWATGADDVWSWPVDVVVGELSSASVAVSTFADGVVQAWVGTGDPVSASVRIPVVADYLVAGSWSFDVELAGVETWLPPRPNERWWVEVQSTTGGTLDGFGVTHEGSSTWGDTGGFVADQAALFWSPPPPEPALIEVIIDPAEIEPGGEAGWSAILVNNGGVGNGPMWASVSTSDPDVTIHAPGPFAVAPTDWGVGELIPIETSFTVAAARTHSGSVSLEIRVYDEVDSWVLTSVVGVPWTELMVTGLQIDDSVGGDGDQTLEVGESAFIEVDLTNVGLRASGALQCVLAVESDAVIQVISDTDDFGQLAPAGTQDGDDFEVWVSSGNAADEATFSWTCSDSDHAYFAETTLVLGEAPWQAISRTPDPTGDALGDSDFDLVFGEWRLGPNTLEIRLRSKMGFDPSLSFVEAWVISNGTPYDMYQIVALNGMGQLVAWNTQQAGPTAYLGAPEVWAVGRELTIVVDRSQLDLAASSLILGFGAGFCGGTDFYCDHFPDEWGEVWTAGPQTDLWFELDW